MTMIAETQRLLEPDNYIGILTRLRGFDEFSRLNGLEKIGLEDLQAGQETPVVLRSPIEQEYGNKGEKATGRLYLAGNARRSGVYGLELDDAIFGIMLELGGKSDVKFGRTGSNMLFLPQEETVLFRAEKGKKAILDGAEVKFVEA